MLRNLHRHYRSCLRSVARLRGSEQGATAIEVAILAPAFLGTLIAVLETAFFLFPQSSLQPAAVQAGRLFMTGQAQTVSQSSFKTQICQNYLPPVFDCNSLIVVVQSYSSFASANTSAPALYNGQGQAVTTWAYTPGSPGLVRVVHWWRHWSVVSRTLGFTAS